MRTPKGKEITLSSYGEAFVATIPPDRVDEDLEMLDADPRRDTSEGLARDTKNNLDNELGVREYWAKLACAHLTFSRIR